MVNWIRFRSGSTSTTSTITFWFSFNHLIRVADKAVCHLTHMNQSVLVDANVNKRSEMVMLVTIREVSSLSGGHGWCEPIYRTQKTRIVYADHARLG